MIESVLVNVKVDMLDWLRGSSDENSAEAHDLRDRAY